MNVRTRLTLAFFTISVLPLAAVTGHTYYSSKRALQQAASQKADTLAAELGRRMDWVTSDLERRMGRVWPMMPNQAPETRQASTRPGPGAPGEQGRGRFVLAPPPREQMTGHVAGALGEVAPMIESMEIVPVGPYALSGKTAPAAPSVPSTPAPPGATVAVPPGAPAESAEESAQKPRIVMRKAPDGRTAERKVEELESRFAELDKQLEQATPEEKRLLAGKFVVEMSSVVAEALKPYAGKDKKIPNQAEIAAWAKDVQAQIQRGMVGVAAAPQPAATPVTPETPVVPPVAAPSGGAVVQEAPSSPPASTKVEKTRDILAAQELARRRRAAEASARETRAQLDRRQQLKTHTVFKGAALDTTVQRNGQDIGHIRARLNYERMFGAILPMTRRDEGEIPFAIDADGRLHGPRGDERESIRALNVSAPESGAAIRTEGDWVVVTRKDKTGVTFGIARPLGDDLRGLRSVAAQNFAVGFGLITLVFLGSVPLAGSMTRNLRTLMEGVRRISAGDLSARVPVKSRDEFGQLAGLFNQMAASLSEHEKLVVQQERLQRELELCRLIQTEMLPRAPLRLGIAEINGVSIPAREVGGDFFNYFVLPSGEIALLVGDVSGKGVGAALLMANVQATLRARLPLEQDLAQLADALDHDIGANTPPEVYLTLFVAILDPKARRLRYVNAGHNTQFALRADGGIERMASTGMPLGLLPGHGFEERAITTAEGDVLFFYTDGTVEMANEAGELLGADRLEAVLLADPRRHVDALLSRIEREIAAFRGKAEPTDDATMMALRIGPN